MLFLCGCYFWISRHFINTGGGLSNFLCCCISGLIYVFLHLMEQFLSLKVEFIQVFWMGVGGGMELLLVVMPLLQYTKKYIE